MGRLVVPGEHLGFLGRIVIAPGLQHQALGAGSGENVGGHAASCAGTDDDGVIDFGACLNLGHGLLLLGCGLP